MPTSVPNITKHTFVGDLADLLGIPLRTTTSAGSTLTLVDAELIDLPPEMVTDHWIFVVTGDAIDQWRQAKSFAPSTGTTTVGRAYTATPGNAINYRIFPAWLRPDLITPAANEAIDELYSGVYRQADAYLLSENTRQWYSLPSGVIRAHRILQGGVLKKKDLFDRAASATAPGGDWTVVAGTWGISAEQLYSASDVADDQIFIDVDTSDGEIETTIRGLLNHATVYRTPRIMFRVMEDYLNARITTDFLEVRLLNGQVLLRKFDLGTYSTLATGTLTTSDSTDYLVQIVFFGPRIRVFVDRVPLIDYALIGDDLKYLSGKQAGIFLEVAGTPAVGTTARINDFRAFSLEGFHEHHDWQQIGQAIRFGEMGNRTGLLNDKLLLVEGSGLLSRFDDDTTFGVFANPTESTLEIQTFTTASGNTEKEPQYSVLLRKTAAILFRNAAHLMYGGSPEEQQRFLALAEEWERGAQNFKHKHGAGPPTRMMMYPY